MKKLFRNFEENCGWKSIVKFCEYCEQFESKKNYSLVLKRVEEFKQENCIKKDYFNFRRYCLNK